MNIHVDTIIAGTPQEIHGKKTLILFFSVIRDICKIKKKFVGEKDIWFSFSANNWKLPQIDPDVKTIRIRTDFN